jgi:hypothetical protein
MTGIIRSVADFEILKRYFRLVYESPLAKTRYITATLSESGIPAMYVVSFFAVF